jgi:predicted enzyme related to lactoylglutathione lyase
MSNKSGTEIGSIVWADLTIENAEKIRDFYSQVVGWQFSPVSMEDYNDYNMNSPESGNTRAGICHARGGNANLPPYCLIYITVEDVESSAEKCREQGGKILVEPKKMGDYGRYCVIQDPAGAVAALYTPPE